MQTWDAEDPMYGPGGLLDFMKAGGMRVRPANWDRFLREQTPTSYIEDRRRYDPTMQPPGSWPY
jgi:hypothetical protein